MPRTSRLLALSAVAALAVLFLLVSSAQSAVNNQQRSARQRAAPAEEASCHMREFDLCLASLTVFTSTNNQHPVSNAEINRQCKILLETEGCLKNFTTRCMTSSQSQLVDMFADGGLETIRQLCKNGTKTRNNYLKYGDCINNQGKQVRVCMRDFQVSLEKAADIEWQDRLKLGCCAYNKLNACMRDIIEPKCGAEAYEMQREFFRAALSRLPSISCAKYDHSSKACGSLLPAAGSLPKGAKSHSVLSKLFSAYSGQ